MKNKIFFIAIIFSLVLLVITACDDSTSPEKSNEENVEAALSEVNVLIDGMTNSEVGAALQMLPDSLSEDSISILPKASLNKEIFSNKIFREAFSISGVDSNIISIIFEGLSGTHTFDGQKWIHAATPADEIIIIYPYINPNTSAPHSAQIRVYGLSLSSSQISVSAEIYIDNVKSFWATLLLSGNNLLGVVFEPEIASVSISGGLVNNSAETITYSISVSNSQVSASIQKNAGKPLTLTATGSNFLDSGMEGATVDNLSLTYGSLEMNITEFEADSGDIGDVLYSGKKVGDLVIINDELYIVYLNGTQIKFVDFFPSLAMINP